MLYATIRYNCVAETLQCNVSTEHIYKIMSVFKDTFRIESARHPDWNYADNGMYFVTICTHNKVCYFGEVINERMQLTSIGQTVNKFWLEIPKHFPNVILDEYIIMPNHLHGIIFICNDDMRRDGNGRRDVALQRLYTGQHKFMSQISPQPLSLSTIIRSFKSICTKTINQQYLSLNFSWQSRFYDRIIRNEYELRRIRDYVYYNAAKWDTDKNNSEDLFC